MGRPPKPTELAKLQGLPSRRALPDDQPVPPKGEIVPPDRLEGKARTYFVSLAATLAAYRPSLAYPADAQIIARYCETLVEYEELVAWKRAYLRKLGDQAGSPSLTYVMRTKAEKGQRSQITGMAMMPQAKEIKELKSDLLEMEEQLGLTPKARSIMRVRAVVKTLPDAAPADKPKPSHWDRSPSVVAKIGGVSA